MHLLLLTLFSNKFTINYERGVVMDIDFGATLAHLRKKKGLSQKQFASIFGITSGAVGMWEKNKRRPDIDMVRKIAIYYGVTLDSILDVQLPETACSEEELDEDARQEYVLLKTFRLLDKDNKDIAIGEIKKLLKDQRLLDLRNNIDKAPKK